MQLPTESVMKAVNDLESESRTRCDDDDDDDDDGE